MNLNLIIATLISAQSVPLAVAETDTIEQSNAAYEELSAGQTEAAIARLEAALKEHPGDPSLLINLGTAYARAGRIEDARDAFRAAISSEDRYQLQLADGTWEDSRRVARLALSGLNDTALASK